MARHGFATRTALTVAAGVAILSALAVGQRSATADGGPVLAGSTAYNSQRKVARGPDGQIAITYVDSVSGVSTVVAKTSVDEGSTWRHLEPLSTDDAFRSSLAFDGTGDLHVTWTERTETGRQVFYARAGSGGGWVDREQLSDTPGYSGYPSVAVDSAETVHVVWYGLEGATYQVYYRYRDSGGRWSRTVKASRFVDDANAPAVAVGPDDTVHVAFFTFVAGEYDVMYMQGGPDGWSPVERVNREGLSARQPSIVVHRDGTAAVAYTSGEGESTTVVYAERLRSGWTPAVAVSPPGMSAGAPSLAASADGGAYAAFETADGRVLLAAMDATGTWSAAQVVAQREAAWPSLAWAFFPSSEWSIPAAPPTLVWTEGGPGQYRLGLDAGSQDGNGKSAPDSSLTSLIRYPGSAGQMASRGALVLGVAVASLCLAGVAHLQRQRRRRDIRTEVSRTVEPEKRNENGG